MSWFEDVFKQGTQDWVFSRLGADQVQQAPIPVEGVAANDSYVSVRLRSLRLVNVRHLTRMFYPVAHSFTSLLHRGKGEAEFQVVTTPTKLTAIDPSRLDRVIQANIPLLGPVPYRGGGLGLELGLFSVEEADLAKPFLAMLEGLSAAAGVSVVSTAMQFVTPLKQGIEAITGTAGGAILEIGVSTRLDPLTTGYYIVMRAHKDAVAVENLIVTGEDFRLVDRRTGQPVADFPYNQWC